MEKQSKQSQTGNEISEETLQDVSGGNNIQKRRIEHLDTNDSSKAVKDIQEARLDHLNNQTN